MLQPSLISSGVACILAICALAVGVQSRHMVSRFTTASKEVEVLGCESAWPHLRSDITSE